MSTVSSRPRGTSVPWEKLPPVAAEAPEGVGVSPQCTVSDAAEKQTSEATLHTVPLESEPGSLEETNDFLQTCDAPRLGHEAETLKRSIITEELDSVVKNLPTHTRPRPDVRFREFYRMCKERLMAILLELFQKLKERKISLTHFIKPPLP